LGKDKKGNQYAIAALKEKRATVASEIVQLKGQLRHREELLVHIDCTLKAFDPSIDVATIRNKRLLPQRVRIFRQGELGRLILGVLRKASRPLSTPEIVADALAEHNLGADARAGMAHRIRPNLAYLEKRGMVVKSGSGKAARWELAG
jgi:hypothetical protein